MVRRKSGFDEFFAWYQEQVARREEGDETSLLFRLTQSLGYPPWRAAGRSVGERSCSVLSATAEVMAARTFGLSAVAVFCAARIAAGTAACSAPTDNGVLLSLKTDDGAGLIDAATVASSDSAGLPYIVQYIYGLALEQNVNWEPYFEAAIERKRVPKE